MARWKSSFVIFLMAFTFGLAVSEQTFQNAWRQRTTPRSVTTKGSVEESEETGDVTEVQHATCEINTDELVATAQATATRVLKGLCNAKEIEDRFHNLETQLADQLNVLKTMVLNVEDKMGAHGQQMRKQHRRLLGAILNSNSSGGGRGGSTGVADSMDDSETDSRYLSIPPREETSPREMEIQRLNSTIHLEAGHQVFTYYWRIKDMEYKLTDWNHRRSLRSQSFYIFPEGYRMYLRIYPRQQGENVYIHVGLTKGEYDETLEWPFKLQHKVNVLDQSTKPQDITSRLWDPTQLCSSGWNWRKPVKEDNMECVGLGFPHDVIKSRDYIYDDAVVVKLTVFLD